MFQHGRDPRIPGDTMWPPREGEGYSHSLSTVSGSVSIRDNNYNQRPTCGVRNLIENVNVYPYEAVAITREQSQLIGRTHIPLSASVESWKTEVQCSEGKYMVQHLIRLAISTSQCLDRRVRGNLCPMAGVRMLNGLPCIENCANFQTKLSHSYPC